MNRETLSHATVDARILEAVDRIDNDGRDTRDVLEWLVGRLGLETTEGRVSRELDAVEAKMAAFRQTAATRSERRAEARASRLESPGRDLFHEPVEPTGFEAVETVSGERRASPFPHRGWTLAQAIDAAQSFAVETGRIVSVVSSATGEGRVDVFANGTVGERRAFHAGSYSGSSTEGLDDLEADDDRLAAALGGLDGLLAEFQDSARGSHRSETLEALEAAEAFIAAAADVVQAARVELASDYVVGEGVTR